MNFSRLQKFAWAFFALAITTTTVFAQGWRNGNGGNFTQNNVCPEQISGLTEDQKSKITEMENNHQKVMEELRTKRRSTSDAIEKSEIRTEMLKNVQTHQQSVKGLLTENQQKEFDLLHFRGNNQGNRIGNRQFQGNGQFRGNGRFAGNNGCRFQGKQMGNRRFNRMNYSGCGGYN